MLMMLLRWVVMPARPGPADARDAPGGPGACLTSVADAPDDVVRLIKCLQGQGQLMPMRLSLVVCLLVGAYG